MRARGAIWRKRGAHSVIGNTPMYPCRVSNDTHTYSQAAPSYMHENSFIVIEASGAHRSDAIPLNLMLLCLAVHATRRYYLLLQASRSYPDHLQIADSWKCRRGASLCRGSAWRWGSSGEVRDGCKAMIIGGVIASPFSYLRYISYYCVCPFAGGGSTTPITDWSKYI